MSSKLTKNLKNKDFATMFPPVSDDTELDEEGLGEELDLDNLDNLKKGSYVDVTPYDIPEGASILPPKKQARTEATMPIEEVLQRKKTRSSQKDRHKNQQNFTITPELKAALKLRTIKEPDKNISEHIQAALTVYLRDELKTLF